MESGRRTAQLAAPGATEAAFEPATVLREIAQHIPPLLHDEENCHSAASRLEGELALLHVARLLRRDLNLFERIQWIRFVVPGLAGEVSPEVVHSICRKGRFKLDQVESMLNGASSRMSDRQLLTREEVQGLTDIGSRVVRIEMARVPVALTMANIEHFGGCQRCDVTGNFRPHALVAALVEPVTHRPLAAVMGRLSDGADTLLQQVLEARALSDCTLLWALERPMCHAWDLLRARDISVICAPPPGVHYTCLRDLPQGGYLALARGLSMKGDQEVHVVEHQVRKVSNNWRARTKTVFSHVAPIESLVRRRLGFLEAHRRPQWLPIRGQGDQAIECALTADRPAKLSLELQARVCIDSAHAGLEWQAATTVERTMRQYIDPSRAVVLPRREAHHAASAKR